VGGKKSKRCHNSRLLHGWEKWTFLVDVVVQKKKKKKEKQKNSPKGGGKKGYSPNIFYRKGSDFTK